MHEGEERLDALRGLARDLGISIHDVTLFDEALTHASIGGEHPGEHPHYESLEFLGDAVLGLAAAHHLYETRPNLTPGEYTRLRAALVQRDAVARVGGRLGIAPYIRLGKGEESAGGRERAALLADCTEALIAALYLDSGWEAARAFVVRAFADEFDEVADAEVPMDPRSALQEWSQARGLGLPRYALTDESGPDHDKRFTVAVEVSGATLGKGEGTSKKSAQQAAAADALDQQMKADAESA